MPKEKKPLLLYVTRREDPNKELLAASLAQMAEGAGHLFEAYFAGYSTGAHYPFSWPFHSRHGEMYGVGPFQGEGHAEQFYWLANAFALTLIRTEECLRFAYEAGLFGLAELVAPQAAPLLLLEKARAYLGAAQPGRLVALGEKTGLKIAPYVYPEIFFTRAWGLRTSEILAQAAPIRARYGARLHGLYLSAAERAALEQNGFEIEAIDTLAAGEDYNTVTVRIAERWKTKARAIAYADPYQAEHYVPYNCQEKILTLFNQDIMPCVPTEAQGWSGKEMERIERGFKDQVIRFARELPSRTIYGRQAEDNLITDLSKDGFIFPVFDPHRPMFPIKRKLAPVEFPGSKHSLFMARMTPAEVRAAIVEKNRIPVSFVTYSADLRHVSGLRNLLEVVALRKMPFGLTVIAPWFIHHPEWLGELLIPLDQGGVFPLVEPLLGSAGWGLCCAAEGYIDKDTLTALLTSALGTIAQYVGRANVPRGLYPFQDANPEYIGTAAPLFSAYRAAGLEFCFSQKDYGTFPHLVYQAGDFVALSQPLTFFPGEFFEDPVREIRRWEKEIVAAGRPGYITAIFDFPLWFQSPYILDMGPRILAAIDYVKGGGDSGRLTPVAPSELAAYARLAEVAQALRACKETN